MFTAQIHHLLGRNSSGKGKVLVMRLTGLLIAISLLGTLTSEAITGRSQIEITTLAAVPAVETGMQLSPSVLTSNAVTEWNQHAAMLSVLPASALSPIQQTRVMAIIQVAVHDAVNGITREYETYLSPGAAPDNASPDAAAIAAAYHTLKTLFGSQTPLLTTLYTASLAAYGLSDADPGIAYGTSAAVAILALRSTDHASEAQFEYTAPGAGDPGVWERLNNAPALLPGWGNVTPFVLRSSSQFLPDPPPARDTELYARDYNEIKQIGVQNGSTRTNEQSQIALFWRASPTAIWNPVLSQVIASRDFDLSETARIFALFYLAASDSSVACWEAKYTYNFWRPQPAIRKGDLDGNGATDVDQAWTPFLPTPPHPEYPSGHTTNSTAMATILTQFFDDNPGVPIVVTIAPITREWSTFSEAIDEVVDARVYSGIHFRNSDEVGVKLGRQVAHFVSTHALRPCRGNGSRCR